MSHEHCITSTQNWVQRVVVGLNLCPFAKRELAKNRVRYCVSNAREQDQLLGDLEAEFKRLDQQPEIETTLLIHPYVLEDFFLYNHFLALANDLLVQLDLEGIYQLASFHPEYQFGGTDPEDAENYTNRSPFAMLHIIREEGLALAIENYPDVDLIPENNIALLNDMGRDKLSDLLKECLAPK
ncbi:MAG: hypothetical protein COB04_14635 [Gammaproteobacteria bacterium]|nr:MAG: hypothetical protein COB04_14635 [Gammaproteobacteria bacterium]